MSLVQIAMIWGAASAALFSFPAQCGEWENFKDLKEALVRSSARRDLPLPAWAASLDYKRPYHFWDVQPKKDSGSKSNEQNNSAPVAGSLVPTPDDQPPR